jgi:hypothetical protein
MAYTLPVQFPDVFMPVVPGARQSKEQATVSHSNLAAIGQQNGNACVVRPARHTVRMYDAGNIRDMITKWVHIQFSSKLHKINGTRYILLEECGNFLTFVRLNN